MDLTLSMTVIIVLIKVDSIALVYMLFLLVVLDVGHEHYRVVDE